MYYLSRKRVAGRSPYLIWNYLEEVWRGTRGAIYCIGDTWVFKFEPYRVVSKVRCLRPGSLTVKVTHSDGNKEVLLDEVVYPGRFYEETFESHGGSEVGDEIFEFVFKPRILGAPERFSFNIPVLEYPTRIVIRREGVVAGRVRRRTRTLPAVRKVATLGVLGEYDGYQRELRSIFSEYNLRFGKELKRNLILKPEKWISKVAYDGNLTLSGDIDKLTPIILEYKDYFRSQEVYEHKSTVFGGIKT